jgi:hypothetical protein
MPVHTEERSANRPAPAGNVVRPEERSDIAADGEAPIMTPTGPAAAAILAVGIGVFVLGLCAILGDAFAPMAALFNWVPRTGPLAGVTACAVVLWLLSWWGLERRWSGRDIELRAINRLAAVLFVIGLLLSFPPLMDMLQGK